MPPARKIVADVDTALYLAWRPMSPLNANQLQSATGECFTMLDEVAQQAANSAGRNRGPAVRNTDNRPTGHRQIRQSSDTVTLTASTCSTPP